jgi:UPF0755 protein
LSRDRSRPDRERTAADRQRDREERERRRAAREGTPPLAAPPHAEPLEAPDAVAPEQSYLSSAEPPSTQAPEPHDEHEEPIGHEPLAEHAPPAPAGASSPLDPEPDPGAELEPDIFEHEPPADAHQEPIESDDAIGAHDATESHDTIGAHEPIDPGPARLDPLEPVILPASGGRGLAGSGVDPPTPVILPPPGSRGALGGGPDGRGRTRRRRSPPARIGALLALAAVIAAVFLLLRTLTSSKQTAKTTAPSVVTVLIPEGETRAQIAQIAAARHLKGSYTSASRHSALLDPARYGAPHGTAQLEGFLFPATYELNVGDPASKLVHEQLIAFREHFSAKQTARARALHVTPYELLTVASMIEREALIPSDRAKIAAVIYNRLARGIPLGIDATIYYAVERARKIATYTHELTESELHIDSPYNTRLHTGLPPTPISNPGVASIEAAAHPSSAGYLYYVAGADGCGEQVFSTTLAAFEANVAAYQAAVAKNGGRPPSCKKK